MDQTRRFEELPDILTVDETAEFLRLGRSSVYDAIQARVIPALRIGRRILIPKSALLAMLDGQLTAPSPTRKDE